MSDHDRPIWLLDVDGPISASRAGWSAAPFNAIVTAQRDFKLHWSPALIDRIRRIHRRGQAEIWWCTTWCPWAYLLEDLWSLPEFPRALSDDVCRAGRSVCHAAKVDAARTVIASGRRLVWTDDEVTPTEGPLFDQLTKDGRALLIAPSSSRGLRPEHLDAIEAFCGPGHDLTVLQVAPISVDSRQEKIVA